MSFFIGNIVSKLKNAVVLFLLLNLVFTSLLTSVTPVFAAPGINKQLGYQGVLKNPSGNTIPNASYDMVFKIYNVSSGGTPLWTGTYTATNGNPVTTNNGFFHVLLGSGTGNALNLDFNTDSYYLGITVGSDAEMSPRQRIGAAGYAFNADTLDGLDSTAFLSSLAAPTGSNANGGSISSSALTLSLADGTNPGLVSTGVQTFAGNKTFAGNVGIGTTSPTANLSFGALAATINNAVTNGSLQFSSNGTGNIVFSPGTSGTVQLGNSPTQSVFVSGGNFLINTNPQIISTGQILPGAPMVRNGLHFLEPTFVNGVATVGNNYVGFQTPAVDLATTTVWDLPSADGDLPRLCLEEADEELDQRRLPRAVGAQDRNELALFDAEIDSGERLGPVVVGEGDPLNIDRPHPVIPHAKNP